MQKIFERLPTPKEGGYWIVKVPGHYPTGKPYDYEHRALWWYHHGELPPKGWHIHHINGDPSDNRMENLQCIHASQHVKMKGHVADLEPAAEEELTCCHCNKKFIKIGHTLTNRRNLGQDHFFCTKSCQVTYQNQFKKGKTTNYPKNHKQAVAKTLTLNCHACAKEFQITERNYRSRTKQGVKKFSCSRSCINKPSLTYDYGSGTCVVCNKDFKKLNQRHDMYCSQTCNSHAHYLRSKPTSCTQS